MAEAQDATASHDSLTDIPTVKLVFLGDAGVGKSCVIARFTTGFFPEGQPATVGAAFLNKVVRVGEVPVRFQIWDTAGSERYRSLASMYYRNASAAVITYDITNQKSFLGAQEWAKELRARSDRNPVIALAGNKHDRADARQVTFEAAHAFAAANGMLHYETSAKTGHNVAELFSAIAEHLPSMMIKSLQRFETAVQCQMDIAQVEKDLAKERKKKGHAAAAKSGQLEAELRALKQRRDATTHGWEVDGRSAAQLNEMLRDLRSQMRGCAKEAGLVLEVEEPRGREAPVRLEAAPAGSRSGCPCS